MDQGFEEYRDVEFRKSRCLVKQVATLLYIALISLENQCVTAQVFLKLS
jgi:hypothetical protein